MGVRFQDEFARGWANGGDARLVREMNACCLAMNMEYSFTKMDNWMNIATVFKKWN
jgi:hypothetical protein